MVIGLPLLWAVTWIVSPQPAPSPTEEAPPPVKRLLVSRSEAERQFLSLNGTGRGDRPARLYTLERDRRRGYDAAPTHRGNGEAYWRARVRERREEIARAEAELEAAKRQAGQYERNPAHEWDAGYDRRRGLLLDRRDRAARHRDEAYQEYEQLREEARKSGASPGWLR